MQIKENYLVTQIKDGIIKYVDVNVNYHECEKYYSWNPTARICENSKHLQSVSNTSVTECDEYE